MMNEFQNWNESIKSEISHVSELLAQKLSDEPQLLIDAVLEVEVWGYRMGALLAQADSWLDRYRSFAMPSKTDRTEMDRKVLLDSEVAPIRLVRDTIESMCDGIKTRITLAQSLLAYHRAQIEVRMIQPRNLEKIY